jgi:hypothetical protein
MLTGKIVGYVITPDKLVLKLIIEDGVEVEVPIKETVATFIGDDIFHGMYTREDDEKRTIRSITRTFDPASECILERDDDIEYGPEEGKK